MSYKVEGKDLSERNLLEQIPKEKFRFVQQSEKLHDQKFETEPVGYFKDAFRRFRKNKGSVVGGLVIIFLVLFALIGPLVSRYDVADRDAYYAYALPKNQTLARFGFWDGSQTVTVNQQTYDRYTAIPGAVVEHISETVADPKDSRKGSNHTIRLDSYAKVGYVYKTITAQEYEDTLAYEQKTGNQVLYPLIDDSQVTAAAYQKDANAWYLTNEKGTAKRTEDGELQDIYLRNEAGEPIDAKAINGNTQYSVRVLYSEWYTMVNGAPASFLFGADANGYDILVRLASGARLSFLLSITVSAINLCIGIVIGSLEGYYGGAFDLAMERVKEFLYEIPSVVIYSLFQLHLASKVGPVISLLFAFVFFGWISTSSTVRAQFYRFKGQEYVMAARTLGARDRRLIFRHILPNGIGYIITASVLSIPGTIMSEASLSYLGIVNLQSDAVTSIGTMLSNGQATLSTYPHCLFFPAAFIALLMICFNIFGNGLRDAFNPSLRGAEE